MPSDRRQPLLDSAVLGRVAPLDLIAREVVEGMRVGMHRSPLHGFSTEFAQHRQYVAGDAPKHIDWRVFGRQDRYFVKLYEAETDFRAHLLVDASRSMGYGSGATSKLAYAKVLAASLAYLIVDQRDAAGLAVFDDALRSFIPPSGTMAAVRRIAAALDQAEGGPSTDVAGILDEIARRIRRRSLVLLFSDCFDDLDGFIKGLDHLRFRGHDVTVFHVLDPAELTFPFDGSMRFLGLEGEGEILTQPKRVREVYLREMQAFLDRLKQACERRRCDYLLADTSRDPGTLLSAWLHQRATTRAAR